MNEGLLGRMVCNISKIAGISLILIVDLPLIWSTVGAQSATPAPDFSGMWGRNAPDFEPPPSGPGPVMNRSRLSNGTRNLDSLVGDYTNPILKRATADRVKKNGEIQLRGENYPTPSNQCWPWAPPYVLREFEMQMLQAKDRITLLYFEDHQVRHVRLNGQHPAHVTPSWTGDSVGHYEGDTLVIDTIGFKAGPMAIVDDYGTPHSEALHVVERYRLIDGQAAKEAAERNEKENGRVPAEFADLLYKGKGLQIQIVVEDSSVFTMPWSATVTYRRGNGEWDENVCAENTHEYYAGANTAIPHADKPDF